MRAVATVGSEINGHVGHHAGHIIGYTGDPPQPIYCSGHAVSGIATIGDPHVQLRGVPLLVVGSAGTTACPCDGAGFRVARGNPRVFVRGRQLAFNGDTVDIHGQGSGNITTGNSHIQTK